MPVMQTNSAVEGYLQNNRSMLPLTTPTPTPAVSNTPEFLTPRQLGSFPGGSTAPTVMDTPKDFAAFQRGFTGENALGFMKANPMQAAALASGPLMEATSKPPPGPVIDSDKGANANAGIKYRPNWNNPTPTPNRYGMEQIYNRPTYMAKGGQVEHYDSGGLTPALRMYQELQQQRAGRGPQIDTKQQFEDYMNSVRGGTVRPTLPPTTTPITPTTPIETSTVNTQGGGGGGRGQGGNEGTPGEGFNPTSQGAYAVSQLGQNLSTVSPFLGGIAGAYGNYLAKNVNPNYSHEAMRKPTAVAPFVDVNNYDQDKVDTPFGLDPAQQAQARVPVGGPIDYSPIDRVTETDAANAAYRREQADAAEQARMEKDTIASDYGYNQGLAMQQRIAANSFSPQDANKALRNAYYQSYPRVGTTPEAQQAAIDNLTSDSFYAAKPDYTPESLQQADNALSTRLSAAYPADIANAQADSFAALAPMREYNAAVMAKLNKEAEARQNAELSAQFNRMAETPALREQYNRLNLGLQTDVENNAEPGDRYAPVSPIYAAGDNLVEGVLTPADSGGYAESAQNAGVPAGDAEGVSVAPTVSEPTQGAYLPSAVVDPFAPPTATPTGTYYDNSMAGDKGFAATGGFGNTWRSADGTPIRTADGSALQTGQGAAQESSNDKVNRIVREAQIAAGSGTFMGGDTEGTQAAAAAAAAQAQADREQAGREAARQAESQAAAAAAAAQASQQAAVEAAGGGRGGGGGNAPDGGSRSWGGASSQEGGARGTAGGWAQGGGIHGGFSNPYDLGSYSDGGRLLKGPGDGVSDSIPATIGKGRPARLADGEFVIPARIVSEIGNGSTDAGARKLYAMMDRIQASRKKTVGKGKVAKNTRAEKYLPR
jgi:hypothetical protein